MAQHRYQQYCALARTLDVAGDRWTLLIVRELTPGPRRFTDLLAPAVTDGDPALDLDMTVPAGGADVEFSGSHACLSLRHPETAT